jgi:TPR repeat protein
MTTDLTPRHDPDTSVVRTYQHALDLLQAGETHCAIEILSRLARDGLAPAYACLGSIHGDGLGVARSPRKAMEYFFEGVKRGDSTCMALAAELLTSGALGEIRHDIALPVYHEAAARGSALALRKLGLYYLEGKQVAADPELSFQLLLAAAELGDAFAAYHLATLYESGSAAVARDPERARHWYETAAMKVTLQVRGDPGRARPGASVRDLRLAAHWLHRAADLGSRLAMQSLARMYADGIGVDRDPGTAAAWAARAGTTNGPGPRETGSVH